MKNKITKIILAVLILVGIGTYNQTVSAAGVAKPEDVGREAEYEVLGVRGANQSGGIPEKCGLFDGKQVNEWSTPPVMYWYDSSNYLEINIKEDCNIWRSGVSDYPSYKVPLTILKWDGKEYNNITSTKENTLKVVLEPKEELQLSIADDLAENTKLLWISSNTEVATVNENGVVTAIKKGNTTITVKDENGDYEEKINILVIEDASEYRLAIDLKVSKTCRLTIDDYTFSKNVT